MSIENFVTGALSELQAKRYDVAMALACSALDGTTARANKNDQNNKRFKEFLSKYMHVVTRFGFPGIQASGIRIGCRNITGDSKIQVDADGRANIEDIIYHIVRCSVVHECSIDERIEFTDRTVLGDFDTRFRMPKNMIFGLLAAVVLCSENQDLDFSENIKRQFPIEKHNQSIEEQPIQPPHD